jgi:hypothetical protein
MHGLEQLGLLDGRVFDVEVEQQVAEGLEGTEDVAVPAEPLQTLQLRGDFAGRVAGGRVRELGVRWRWSQGFRHGRPMMVIRIVRWNQSSRCSARALR